MDTAEPLIVTEGEYWKMVALDKQVALAKAEADAHINQALLTKHQFLAELDEKYPAFDMRKQYTAVDRGDHFELAGV